ncbi:hypothetical protein [Streptomyces scopuliridis]|uniref:hypothetical protein n=1 Tax=Streptomyces scopuliridis TaxID=452529 RepID=UPI0035DE7A49
MEAQPGRAGGTRPAALLTPASMNRDTEDQMHITMLAVALENAAGDLTLHVANPSTWMNPAAGNNFGCLPTSIGRSARYDEFSPGDAERILATEGWNLTSEGPGALGAWTEHPTARAYTAHVERELWPVSRVAEELGYGGPSATGSARKWLSRKGVAAEVRAAGRGGEAHYSAHHVRQARDTSPGSGRHGAKRVNGKFA